MGDDDDDARDDYRLLAIVTGLLLVVVVVLAAVRTADDASYGTRPSHDTTTAPATPSTRVAGDPQSSSLGHGGG